MGYKTWKDEPWARRPEVLLAELEQLYREAIRLGKVQSVAKTAAKKAIANREWCASVPAAAVEAVMEDLEVIYVPKGVGPGAAFLFPIRDVSGEVRRAHLRIVDESVYGFRYISLVNPERFTGPGWGGFSEETVEGIISTGEVTLMEGPFDLAAMRIAEPRLPTLCPLTKRLNDEHWDDLKMMGVRRIQLMLDNEKKGALAASLMARRTDFEITPVTCPAKDPSDALKTNTKFQLLRATLRDMLPATLLTATFTLDED